MKLSGSGPSTPTLFAVLVASAVSGACVVGAVPASADPLASVKDPSEDWARKVCNAPRLVPAGVGHAPLNNSGYAWVCAYFDDNWYAEHPDVGGDVATDHIAFGNYDSDAARQSDISSLPNLGFPVMAYATATAQDGTRWLIISQAGVPDPPPDVRSLALTRLQGLGSFGFNVLAP